MAKLPMETETRLTMRRERRIAVSATSLEELVLRLRAERFTGKLVVNMSQGGFQSALVEDSTPVLAPDG
jgi:hypothetical protein